MSSIIVILFIAGSVVMAEEKMCSSFCSSLGMLQSSPGKSCADIYQISKASRGVSGLYWINTTTGLHQVNCDMELECGGHKGGWTKIVKFDTSKGDPCPSGWTKFTTIEQDPQNYDPPRVVCQSGYDAGCYSTNFTTYDITFNKICGKVRAYQQGTTHAFHGDEKNSINDIYVDGVSITLGYPRKHIWTYAAGLGDDSPYPASNCPCAATPGPDPLAFVGNDYYCESGNHGWYYTNELYYTTDPLWDGDGCRYDASARVNCCTNPNLPWFFQQFVIPMNDYIEARICHRSGNADVLVESFELYVQ